jgi:hypothetical protein
MRALAAGEVHTRKMLLCKVAQGKVHRTTTDMDYLSGAAPPGFHSVHGEATRRGRLNYDELVVYEEAAILPYAVVEYHFRKIDPSRRRVAQHPNAGQRKLRRVCVLGTTHGASVAAALALQGDVEVRIWGFQMGGGESKAAVTRALKKHESRFAPPPGQEDEEREQGGGGGAGGLTSPPTPPELRLAHPLCVGADQRVQGFLSIAEAVDGCQLVCEAVLDKMQAKIATWKQIVSAPQLPADAFLTTQSFNLALADIAKHLPVPRRQRFMGLRHMAPCVGVPVVEATYVHEPQLLAEQQGERQLRELATLLAELGLVLVVPPKQGAGDGAAAAAGAKRRRGWESMCQQGVPPTPTDYSGHALSPWPLDTTLCVLCRRRPAKVEARCLKDNADRRAYGQPGKDWLPAYRGPQFQLCMGCVTDHRAQRVVSDAPDAWDVLTAHGQVLPPHPAAAAPSPSADVYAGGGGAADPYLADPYAGAPAASADPYAGAPAASADPYAGAPAASADPYAGSPS